MITRPEMNIPAEYLDLYKSVNSSAQQSGLLFRVNGKIVNESSTVTEPTKPTVTKGEIAVDGYGTTTLDEVVRIFAEVHNAARQRRAQRA
jgi:hypothetical protein